ncbi:MAG: hypothetical protein JO185_22260 [Acidobacteriaceae bacterium]|nr:hypothetical protein [Acidobacteriaceae bacterium]MBV9223343.1 hypothetical protein [Acidobacteriaceae bacterium]MBV9679076.1 hypothetical protein [Acidobacteriaceae bacterium]
MNNLVKEPTPRGAGSFRCNYGPCQCVVLANGLYCSQYCRQAAAQGIERDYCQCEHENTLKKSDFSAVQILHLPGQLQRETDRIGGA